MELIANASRAATATLCLDRRVAKYIYFQAESWAIKPFGTKDPVLPTVYRFAMAIRRSASDLVTRPAPRFHHAESALDHLF